MQKPIPTRNDPWVRGARFLIVLFIAAVLLALSGCSPGPGPNCGQPSRDTAQDWYCTYYENETVYVMVGKISTAQKRFVCKQWSRVKGSAK